MKGDKSKIKFGDNHLMFIFASQIRDKLFKIIRFTNLKDGGPVID
ncbi:MAG: hypothetical protein ACOCX8_00675 [Bacteroidota bacterium]